MSEPPPGAVLMTNSTGRVGCSAVAADAEPAAPPDGAPDAAGFWPPHAAMSRPALMTARNRLPLACNMTSTSTDPYVQSAAKGQCGLTGPDAKDMSVRRKTPM